MKRTTEMLFLLLHHEQKALSSLFTFLLAGCIPKSSTLQLAAMLISITSWIFIFQSIGECIDVAIAILFDGIQDLGHDVLHLAAFIGIDEMTFFADQDLAILSDVDVGNARWLWQPLHVAKNIVLANELWVSWVMEMCSLKLLSFLSSCLCFFSCWGSADWKREKSGEGSGEAVQSAMREEEELLGCVCLPPHAEQVHRGMMPFASQYST